MKAESQCIFNVLTGDHATLSKGNAVKDYEQYMHEMYPSWSASHAAKIAKAQVGYIYYLHATGGQLHFSGFNTVFNEIRDCDNETLGDTFSGESTHNGVQYCTQIQGQAMVNPTYGPMLKKQYAKHLADYGPGGCVSKGYSDEMYHMHMKILGGMNMSVWGK